MSDASGRAADSPGVHLEGVSRSFGAVEAVKDVHLDVVRGEFFSLLGPSGCGKTTLLRLIAGFERPDRGRIMIGGHDVTTATPQRRPTAMVFQNYALFPTMTVGQNVAYGLEVRRVPRRERRQRVQELLQRVDLPGLEDRPVTLLSGGQQQRVALARALAVEPDVLLFDEPLSNLDVALREQTRVELKQLQHRLGTTSVYVTHDQQEALALSDRVGVMREGRLLQVAPPRTLFREPSTAFVAQFLGWNLVRSSTLSHRLTAVQPPEGCMLAVRPESWETSGDNGVPARVTGVQFLGTHAEWLVEAEGESLRVWVSPDAEPATDLRLSVRAYRWLPADVTVSRQAAPVET